MREYTTSDARILGKFAFAETQMHYREHVQIQLNKLNSISVGPDHPEVKHRAQAIYDFQKIIEEYLP